MLKPSKFNDILKGIDKILAVIESKTGGDVCKIRESSQRKNEKKNVYLDTVDFKLNHRDNFLVRIREEEENW